MKIESRVHRILKPIPRFRGSASFDSLPLALSKKLEDDEVFFGIYSNPDGIDQVVITSKGIRTLRESEQINFVKYEDIQDVRPADDSKRVGGVQVVLTSGLVELLPIFGGQDRQLDSFEFLRFLMRVLEDLNRDQSSDSREQSKVPGSH